MTKALQLPSQERLVELFDYDAETGVFTWNDSVYKNAKKGRIAGCLDKTKGYRRLLVDGRQFCAHRLAWVYHYGEDPGDKQVDHINGDRADNRIENLRLVTNQQNAFNMRPKGKSGFKGVTPVNGKFVARIYPNNKQIILGTFGTPEEASDAYQRAAKKYFGEHRYGSPVFETGEASI